MMPTKNMNKLIAVFCLVLMGVVSINTSSLAQSKKPVTYKGEITNLDAFNTDIRTKGAEATLFGIYLQRVKTQIIEFEKSYAKLEYSPDSVQSIINSVIKANKNEVMANAIDLSQGMAFNIKQFSSASGTFEGKLSPSVEKQVFDLQWTSKNKAPLKNLKTQQPDFGNDLEQILVNEANANGLVEALLRNIVYDRVKARLSNGMIFTLSPKDSLGNKIGQKLEQYFLSNYQKVLSDKKIDQLVLTAAIVDKY
jgi:hypothetical protein